MMETIGKSDWIPRIGMEFTSPEEAWEFWVNYAGKIGFNARKHYCHRSTVDGIITSRSYVCSNEGFRQKDKRDDNTKRPRHETRCGCSVCLDIKLNRESNKYVVGDFMSKHNHMLQLPEACYLLPCQRKITKVAACDIDLADDFGIVPKAAHELMGQLVGGRENIGHTSTDQYNYLRDKRKSALVHGEAVSILRYFCKQAVDNPSFQHSEQVDDQNEISNIFWADAQMIIDYV